MGIKIYNVLDPFIHFSVYEETNGITRHYTVSQSSTGTVPEEFSFYTGVATQNKIMNQTSYPIIASNGTTIAPGQSWSTSKVLNCRIEGVQGGTVTAQLV